MQLQVELWKKEKRKIEHYKPAWFSWGKTMGSFLWVATVLQSTVQTLPLAGKTLTSIETKAM